MTLRIYCDYWKVFAMNLARNMHRASIAGHLYIRNYGILEVNFKILERANLRRTEKVLLNTYSIHSPTGSLVKEPASFSKKRLSKKKKPLNYNNKDEEEGFLVTAFCTAEEYNLEKLALNLQKFTDFKPTTFGSDFGNSVDVVHATHNSKTEPVCQDLFFFRKGCVVMWNISNFKAKNIINFLKSHEESSFVDDLIENESEIMTFLLSENVPKTQIIRNNLVLNNDDSLLDKYAVSNAMALSVQLGVYEASLENYIETMEPVTEDLKAGNKIKMSRNEVLQKTGHLFALRHNINLNSDLLDTPDFYWDREELETVYQTAFNYYCISKRTKVINEKINHCIELVDLLSSHLNDKHHIRLEWMIIVLIMVEVGFEVFHCLEYFEMAKKFIDKNVQYSA